MSCADQSFSRRALAWFQRHQEELIALVSIGLFLAWRYRDVLWQSHINAPWADILYWGAPMFSYLSQVAAAGESPHWVNCITGGIGIYDTGQMSTLYPLFLFGVLDYGTDLQTLRVLTYVVVGHVGLFCLTSYVFARVLGTRPFASALVAMILTATTNTLIYQQYSMIVAYAWLPLFCTGLFLIARTPNGHLGWIVTGGSFGLTCLAAPSQPVIHALQIGVFFLISLLASQPLKGSQWGATMRSLVFAGILAAGLGLVAVVPAAIHLPDTIRWTGTGTVIGNAAVPWQVFTEYQLSWQDVRGILVAGHRSYVLGSPHIGILGVILCFGTTVLFREAQGVRRLALFLGVGILLYGWFSALGSNSFLGAVNYHIPLVNKMREPERHLFLFLSGAGILMAMGAQRILEATTQCRVWAYSAIIAAGLSFPFLTDWSPEIRYSTSAVFAGLFFLIFVSRQHRRAGAWFACMAAMVFVERSYVPNTIKSAHDSEWAAPHYRNAVTALRAAADIKEMKDYRFIYRTAGPVGPGQMAMLGAYYGVRSFYSIWNPTRYQQFNDVWNRDGHLNYRKAMGARWLITTPGANPLEGYSEIRNVAGFGIYETSTVSDYVYVTPVIDGHYKVNEDFLTFFEGRPFQRNSTYVKGDSSFPLPLKGQGSVGTSEPASIRWEERTFNRKKISVSTTAPALVVLNEYPSDDWQISVNGRAAKGCPVNVGQLGVLVPAGGGTVEFYHMPRMVFWFGLLTKVTFWVLVSGCLIFVCRRFMVSRKPST